jgi:putative transposase
VQYQNGKSIDSLLDESGVPQSTINLWIKLFQSTITPTGTIVTPREFDFMKKRIAKLENMVSVLQTVN